MKRTPLYPTHVASGATLVEFAGWEMPLSYAGIVSESRAVRHAAGLFDVSHMGIVEVRGPEARAGVDYLVTCAISDLEVGQARYGLFLYPEGGIMDDVLVYALAEDCLRVVANAVNAEKVYRWIQQHVKRGVRALFGEVAILAVQGPRALEIVECAAGQDLRSLRRFGFARWVHDGAEILLSRTGYTGEDGAELFCPAAQATSWWNRLMDCGRRQGLVPCGLGARDVLRIEAGNVLYGHEISGDTQPVEAGLLGAVSLSKGDFVGRQAVTAFLERPLERRLTGLVMEESAIPRQGAPVGIDTEACGAVTSGTFSPALECGIAMAYLPPAVATVPGTVAWVELRGRRRRARVASLPFVKRRR